MTFSFQLPSLSTPLGGSSEPKASTNAIQSSASSNKPMNSSSPGSTLSFGNPLQANISGSPGSTIGSSNPFNFGIGSNAVSSSISNASSVSNVASINSSNSSAQRALYCRRRHNQVIELNFTNPSNIQLNLIETGDQTAVTSGASLFSPSRFLYSLKSWPVGSTPKRILCNSLGNLMAIHGSSGSVSVLRLQGAVVTQEIELEQSLLSAAFTDFAAFAWHPASPADHHLAILGKSGKLALFDILKATQCGGSFEEEAICAETVSLLRLSEPEQAIKLPSSRTDAFASISFAASASAISSSWLPFIVFLARESGDIFALCPLVPLKFRAQRQNHLIPLKQVETDPIALKWLDETIRSCEFVANSTGDTDWVLATCPSSFSHLQPRPHGPFLIQPEPMEIHQLASYDRVVDFFASDFKVTNSKEPLTLVAVAFGSGKIDFLAVITEIATKFQLKDSLLRSPEESDLLPILALIESVDIKGSEEKSVTRRSTDNSIKFLEYLGYPFFLVSSDNAVIRINLQISCERHDNFDYGAELEDENDWAIECQSTILIEKLKSHVLCVSQGKIYPGAITLDYNLLSSSFNSLSSTLQHVRESSILETITKFAFPLGKMEIEGGAVQLDGLLENLTKTLQRLKMHRSISSPYKLPEIDEIGATEFNDHVSEWQESLVSPAMRVGHEIALRSNELVQILRREREILVRAKTLLTAKPDRLDKLLKNLSEAKSRNHQLFERVQKISQELSKHAVYDVRLIEKICEISKNLRSHPVRNDPQEFVLLENEEELVQAQLAIQTEKLMKLKNRLLK